MYLLDFDLTKCQPCDYKKIPFQVFVPQTKNTMMEEDQMKIRLW